MSSQVKPDGLLAQQIAQVREVVPSREEIERRISQAEAVIAEPDEYPREYLTDALREITRCERLLIADAALSVIERHVQDMETALEPFARDAEAFDNSETTYGDGSVFERLSGEHHWRFTIADVRRARAVLSAREKGTEPDDD